MDSAEKIEISVYLDRIEELEDGGEEAVLLIDEGGEDYSGEFGLPANFLPEGASDGDYLTLKISRESTAVENPADGTAETSAKVSTAENPADGTAETSAKVSTAEKSADGTAETSAKITSVENPADGTAETSAKVSTAENPADGIAETSAKITAAENPADGTAETSAKVSTAEKSADGTAETSAKVSTAENEIRAKLETLDGDDAELTVDGSKLIFPANFLPEDASAGEIFAIEITRDENKTNAALDEARQLLKELE